MCEEIVKSFYVLQGVSRGPGTLPGDAQGAHAYGLFNQMYTKWNKICQFYLRFQHFFGILLRQT